MQPILRESLCVKKTHLSLEDASVVKLSHYTIREGAFGAKGGPVTMPPKIRLCRRRLAQLTPVRYSASR